MSKNAKPATVEDTGSTAPKPTDTTSDTSAGSGSWGEIASNLWKELRTELTKPIGTGKDNGSTENPGGGAGSSTLPEVSLTRSDGSETGSGSGIKLGDGKDRGKKSDSDRGFVHVGEKTGTDGDDGKEQREDDGRGVTRVGDISPDSGGAERKDPRDDGRGVTRVDKPLTEGGEPKEPGDDGGDLEHAGGKTTKAGEDGKIAREEYEDPARHVTHDKLGEGGAEPKPEMPETNPQGEVIERPVPTEPTPKPTLPEVGGAIEKTADDNKKGPNSEQALKKPVLPMPGIPGEPRFSKYGPRPDPTNAEVPSEADQERAEAILQQGDVTDAFGVESLAEGAAEDIINGRFDELQTTLQGLETAEGGEKQLREMAQQLGNLLGTEVMPRVSDDGKFSLSVMTQFSDNRGGDFPTGVSETRLNIPSDGEISASGSRYWNPNYPKSVAADAATEQARLQALATRSVLDLPTFLNRMDEFELSKDQ